MRNALSTFRAPPSLRLWLTIALIVVLAVSAGVALVAREQREVKHQAIEEVTAVLDRTAAGFASRVDEARGQLHTLATILPSIDPDEAAHAQVLRTFREATPAAHHVFVTDGEGVLRHASDMTLVEDETRLATPLVATEGRWRREITALSNCDIAEDQVLLLLERIRLDKTQATLGLSLSTDWLDGLIERTVGGREVHWFVSDEFGQIHLANIDPDSAWLEAQSGADEGATRRTLIDGADWIHVRQPLIQTHLDGQLSIEIAMPLNAWRTERNAQLLRLSAGLGGVVLLALLLVALTVQRGFLRPLRRLGRRAEAVARGEFAGHQPLDRGMGALAPLARSFDVMLASLQSRDEEIRSYRRAFERRMDTLLEQVEALAGLGSWQLDLVTGRARWSDEEYRLLGYAPGEVEANLDNFLAAVHPEDRARVEVAIEAALIRRSTEYELEHRIKTADDSLCLLRQKGRIFYRDGKAIEMIGASLDITRSHQAESELRALNQRMAAHLDHTPLAVIEFDRKRRVRFWNAAAERIFGYAREAIVGHRLVDCIVPEEEREAFARLLTNLFEHRGGTVGATRNRREDGGEIYCEWYNTLLVNRIGEPTGGASLVLDVTREREARRELVVLNRDLEQRVEERTAEIGRINTELEAFSYSVSHDLRTPLRAINGFSALLAEENAERLDARGRDFLDRIRRAGKRASELIDDLLALSRISQGDICREVVDVTRMAGEIAEELHAGPTSRAVEWDIQPGMRIEADPRLLRAALENLLGNAFKFTRHNRLARIRVALVDEGRTLRVEDDGVGFDMRYRDRLFSPFQRLHKEEEFEGSGIGLATVQRIAIRHGGSVSARSQPGRGSTFDLRIVP